MGTTAIGLLCGFLPACQRLWTKWRGGEPARSLWKETRRGAVLTFIVWSLLFAYCIGRVVYDDHEGLVSANIELAEANAQLTARIKSLISNRGESKNKARCRAVREQLGEFLSEERNLLQNACGAPTPACTDARGKLDGRIERYLKLNLESQYFERFKSRITNFGVPWEDIRGDMNILESFIKELE